MPSSCAHRSFHATGWAKRKLERLRSPRLRPPQGICDRCLASSCLLPHDLLPVYAPRSGPIRRAGRKIGKQTSSARRMVHANSSRNCRGFGQGFFLCSPLGGMGGQPDLRMGEAELIYLSGFRKRAVPKVSWRGLISYWCAGRLFKASSADRRSPWL